MPNEDGGEQEFDLDVEVMDEDGEATDEPAAPAEEPDAPPPAEEPAVDSSREEIAAIRRENEELRSQLTEVIKHLRPAPKQEPEPRRLPKPTEVFAGLDPERAETISNFIRDTVIEMTQDIRAKTVEQERAIGESRVTAAKQRFISKVGDDKEYGFSAVEDDMRGIVEKIAGNWTPDDMLDTAYHAAIGRRHLKSVHESRQRAAKGASEKDASKRKADPSRLEVNRGTSIQSGKASRKGLSNILDEVLRDAMKQK